MSTIETKRVYEDPEPSDGYRVLVDRLWPRGVSREEAELDDWRKDLAPSDELRKWFDHDPEKWEEFRERYRDELQEYREDCRELLEQVTDEKLTLLYAAKDRDHNNALVLREYLEELAD